MNLLSGTIVSGTNSAVEKMLAGYKARKLSTARSYRKLRVGYKGKVVATRKPFSQFILFTFDDGSSEFVTSMDSKEFCEGMGIKDPDKFLDYVQNYYKATIEI